MLHSAVEKTKIPEDDSPTYNAIELTKNGNVDYSGKTSLHAPHHAIWKTYSYKISRIFYLYLIELTDV